MRPLYIKATVELCCFLPRRWTGLARVASSVQFRYFGLKFEPSSRWHDTCIQKNTKKKTCLNNWVILLLWNDIKKHWSWNVQITNDFFSCLSAPPTSTHLRPRLYLRASSVLPYMLWFGLPRRECTRTARLIAFQLAIAEAHRVFRQSYEFIGGNAEFCWETVCIK